MVLGFGLGSLQKDIEEEKDKEKKEINIFDGATAQASGGGIKPLAIQGQGPVAYTPPKITPQIQPPVQQPAKPIQQPMQQQTAQNPYAGIGTVGGFQNNIFGSTPQPGQLNLSQQTVGSMQQVPVQQQFEQFKQQQQATFAQQQETKARMEALSNMDKRTERTIEREKGIKSFQENRIADEDFFNMKGSEFAQLDPLNQARGQLAFKKKHLSNRIRQEYNLSEEQASDNEIFDQYRLQNPEYVDSFLGEEMLQVRQAETQQAVEMAKLPTYDAKRLTAKVALNPLKTADDRKQYGKDSLEIVGAGSANAISSVWNSAMSLAGIGAQFANDPSGTSGAIKKSIKKTIDEVRSDPKAYANKIKTKVEKYIEGAINDPVNTIMDLSDFAFENPFETAMIVDGVRDVHSLSVMAKNLPATAKTTLKSLDSFASAVKKQSPEQIKKAYDIFKDTTKSLKAKVPFEVNSPFKKKTPKPLINNGVVQDKKIISMVDRGIKPTVVGKKSAKDLDMFRKDVVESAETIIDQGDKIKLTNEFGEEIGGMPKNLQSFSDAVGQSKRNIYKEYAGLAKEAGETTTVKTKGVTDELDSIINDRTVELTSPGIKKYTQEAKDFLSNIDNMGVEELQTVTQRYNAKLQAFYKNPNFNDVGKSMIDALVKNKLSKSLDDAIETALDTPNYRTLKNKYASLARIEKEVAKRALVDARKSAKGLADYSDIFSAGDILLGLGTMQPAFVAKGVGQNLLKRYFKILNDPNKNIENLFKRVNKMKQKGRTIGKQLEPIKPREPKPKIPEKKRLLALPEPGKTNSNLGTPRNPIIGKQKFSSLNSDRAIFESAKKNGISIKKDPISLKKGDITADGPIEKIYQDGRAWKAEVNGKTKYIEDLGEVYRPSTKTTQTPKKLIEKKTEDIDSFVKKMDETKPPKTGSLTRLEKMKKGISRSNTISGIEEKLGIKIEKLDIHSQEIIHDLIMSKKASLEVGDDLLEFIKNNNGKLTNTEFTMAEELIKKAKAGRPVIPTKKPTKKIISKKDTPQTIKNAKNFEEATVTNKEPIKVYRGEGKGIGNTTYVKGKYSADSKKFAGTFGDITESEIPTGSKIFDFDTIKNNKNQKLIPQDILVDPDKTTQYLIDKGYTVTKNTNTRGIEYVELPVRENKAIQFAKKFDSYDEFKSAVYNDSGVSPIMTEVSQRINKNKPYGTPAWKDPRLEIWQQANKTPTPKKVISKTAETTAPIINNLNPTGSVFSKYGAEARATAKLGDNITTLDKTMKVSPDKEINIYRGTVSSQNKIAPGDFITTNKQLASDYGKNVLEMRVKASDIIDDITEPLGEEYIYRPIPQTKPKKILSKKKTETPKDVLKNNTELNKKFEEFSRLHEQVNKTTAEILGEPPYQSFLEGKTTAKEFESSLDRLTRRYKQEVITEAQTRKIGEVPGLERMIDETSAKDLFGEEAIEAQKYWDKIDADNYGLKDLFTKKETPKPKKLLEKKVEKKASDKKQIEVGGKYQIEQELSDMKGKKRVFNEEITVTKIEGDYIQYDTPDGGGGMMRKKSLEEQIGIKQSPARQEGLFAEKPKTTEAKKIEKALEPQIRKDYPDYEKFKKDTVTGRVNRLKRDIDRVENDAGLMRRNKKRYDHRSKKTDTEIEEYFAGSDSRYKAQYIQQVRKDMKSGELISQDIINQFPELTKAVGDYERYLKGWKTSFANKSTMVEETDFGLKVKRQDGKPILPTQKEEIRNSLMEFQEVHGDIQDILKKMDLTVAHTSGKNPFLTSKTVGGVYRKGEKTITIGVNSGLSKLRGKPESFKAFTHELTHALDDASGDMTRNPIYNLKGEYNKSMMETARNTMKTDLFGDIRMTVKKNLPKEKQVEIRDRKLSLGEYWNRPNEIFARLIEQFTAKKLGDSGKFGQDTYEKLTNSIGYRDDATFKGLEKNVEAEMKRKIANIRNPENKKKAELMLLIIGAGTVGYGTE